MPSPMPIEQFVRENNVTLTAERVPANPRMIATMAGQSGWLHWKVVIKRRRATRCTFTVYFSRRGPSETLPTVEEVLDSLAVDAVAAESFPDDFELSAETGLMRGEPTKAYLQTCAKRAAGLKRVFGVGQMNVLLHGTRRILTT